MKMNLSCNDEKGNNDYVPLYKGKAHINSLNGQLDDVEIIEQRGENDWIALYKGKRCTAIYNPFVSAFYVDDIYGVIEGAAQ